LAITLGVFAIGTMAGLLVEQTTRRSQKTGETTWKAAKTVATGDGAFWSGQLSHAGVVLIAIGIAFAANLGTHAEDRLAPGESAVFDGYTITYESPFQRTAPSQTTVGARFTVTRGSDFVAIVEPSWNFFGGPPGVGTPDVLHGPGGDLYFTLVDLPDDDTGAVTVTFDTSPLIWVLWLGGLVIVAGGFLAMRSRVSERRAIEERPTVDV
ncbi:MAG TPA: cytochrome c-type biogenesis CcmF C-terminal domain-containing protein, partial [Acidimicrobiia bacterium]|nr:cytochrome c-type biogenesis CcmF C-terminal domain-containing protein [Acidimicrobiia bacterium]